MPYGTTNWISLEKIKGEIYEKGWTTDNIPDLINRIRLMVEKITETECQSLMGGLKTKVRKAADRGVLAVIENKHSNH